MKFVEIRVKRFGVFAIVLRIKKDTLTFLRRGNKVNSSVDARISFTCKPGMVKHNVCFTSEVSLVKVRLFYILQWIFTSNVCCHSGFVLRFNIFIIFGKYNYAFQIKVKMQCIRSCTLCLNGRTSKITHKTKYIFIIFFQNDWYISFPQL